MARLKAGEKPTPHNERMRIYRADLEASGGKRLTLNLSPEANAALEKIMRTRGTTMKDSIADALIATAQGLR
jgi:hypothetical protein